MVLLCISMDEMCPMFFWNQAVFKDISEFDVILYGCCSSWAVISIMLQFGVFLRMGNLQKPFSQTSPFSAKHPKQYQIVADMPH